MSAHPLDQQDRDRRADPGLPDIDDHVGADPRAMHDRELVAS